MINMYDLYSYVQWHQKLSIYLHIIFTEPK